MTQEYDIQEYWQQFDDHSRWVGFTENLKANEEKENDDMIATIDFILQTSQEELPADISNSETKECPDNEKTEKTNTEEIHNEVQEAVIKRIETLFLKMKETVK